MMIKNFSISFIETEIFMNVFDCNLPVSCSYVLKDNHSIKQIISDIENSKNKTFQNYSYPWAEMGFEENRFWYYYMKENYPTGDIFQSYIAALFYKLNQYSLNFRLGEDSMLEFTIRPYLYQHGLGIIISAFFEYNEEEPYQIEGIKDILSRLYRAKGYTFHLQEEAAESLSLADVMSRIKLYFEDNIIGLKPVRKVKFNPFSIVAFTSEVEEEKEDLKGGDLRKEVSEDIIRHCFKQSYKGLLPMKCKNYEMETYYSERGRIIWNIGSSSIRCYYMNDLKLSLQIEMLGAFLKEYVNLHSLQENRDNETNGALAAYIADVYYKVMDLYGAGKGMDKPSYMSNSAIAQINDNYLDTIHAIGIQFNLPKIEEKSI
ncbi:MAG: hypothetical protein WBI07_09105 [Mobilitalea sp.]